MAHPNDMHSFTMDDTLDRGWSIPRQPEPPLEAQVRWRPRGEVVRVGGITLRHGMFYTCDERPSRQWNGFVDATFPACINLALPVGNRGDYTRTLSRQWPNYSVLGPDGRHAYLQFLADGACHPAADAGYVFLYFYGLERRMLVDAQHDPAAQAERQSVIDELQRLLAIYGQTSVVFRRYAVNLLEYLMLIDRPQQLYRKPLPPINPELGFPLTFRVAVGQAVADRVPLPAHLALAWVQCDYGITKRTPVQRCGEAFAALFVSEYTAQFGDGMKITPNRTTLSVVYHPASSAYNGVRATPLEFGDLPDVTAKHSITKQLQQIVDHCTEALEPYSRYLARHPGAEQTPEALLLLPPAAWPQDMRERLQALRDTVAFGMVVTTAAAVAEELLGEPSDSLTPQYLSAALASSGVGMAIRSGPVSKTTKPDEPLVLYRCDAPPTLATLTSAAYAAAFVRLQVLSGVALSTGSPDRAFLRIDAEMARWDGLSEGARLHLQAQARLLTQAAPSQAAMKKLAERFEPSERATLGLAAVRLAQADANAAPKTVAFLEKVYLALGLATDQLYRDIHSAGTGAASPATAVSADKPATPEAFALDHERIAQLQRDTENVSALLSTIFVEDVAVRSAPPVSLSAPAPTESLGAGPEPKTPLPGLDGAHAELARHILGQAQWERAALLPVAQRLGLMLDGALECINDAAFDAFDLPFIEGDDLLEVNPELFERLTTT